MVWWTVQLCSFLRYCHIRNLQKIKLIYFFNFHRHVFLISFLSPQEQFKGYTMSHVRRKSFSLTLHVPLLEVWKAAHSATWADREIVAPAHAGIFFSQQKFLKMQIQVPVQCFWLNWSHSQVQILLCQQPSQAAGWHHSQRICPRWAERVFPVPSEKEQTETWENKFCCFTIVPDITELVSLKWHIQLRRVKMPVCTKADCVSCDKSLLWSSHPLFLSFLHFLTALLVSQDPVLYDIHWGIPMFYGHSLSNAG